MLESKSKMLEALIVAALVYFFVATINLLYHAIPIIPWFWQPDEPKKLDIPGNIEDLLPSESDHLKSEFGRFTSLSKFRSKDNFPRLEAIQQYHADPVAYALRLAEVVDEICEVSRQKDPAGYRAWLARDRYKRQRRDFASDDVQGKLVLMTLRELFLPGQAVQADQLFGELGRFVLQKTLRLIGFQGVVQSSSEPTGEILTGAPTEESAWIKQLETFRKNVISFCEHTGSEVDKLATPQENVWRLRRYAAAEKPKYSPLLRQNAQLRANLGRCNRINAALQIRHAIEKLMAELPQSKKKTSNGDPAEESSSKPDIPNSEKASFKKGRYDVWGSGPKWTRFWEDVWEDAQTNVANPFNKLYVNAKGPYARKDIERRGANLFSDMSQDIHWYWFTEGDIDGTYFDDLTSKIAQIIWPTEIDHKTGEPKWEKEIEKYPYKREEVSPETPPAGEPNDGTAAAEPDVSENASGATLKGPPGDDTANNPTSPHDKAAVS